MRYYLDTNIVVFIFINPDQLTIDVNNILNDYNNQLYISTEVVKELVNLYKNDKIETNRWKNAKDFVNFIINETNIEIKYVKEEHLRTFAELPLLADHNDPSDRIIIAQAITEKIPIISSDRKFSYYERYGLDFVFNKR